MNDTLTYQEQAQEFLNKNELKMRITLSNTKHPKWDTIPGEFHNHYVVTISAKDRKSLRFDFWSSANDTRSGRYPTSYDILACISRDQNCPDTFEEFCSDYGYATDSIKADKSFRSLSVFAKRLKKFFTESELMELSEIQ